MSADDTVIGIVATGEQLTTGVLETAADWILARLREYLGIEMEITIVVAPKGDAESAFWVSNCGPDSDIRAHVVCVIKSLDRAEGHTLFFARGGEE